MRFFDKPVQFPHCDSHILHSPGVCQFCDRHPDWQALRESQGVAFSDMSTEDAIAAGLVPCPSTYYRTAELRDLWGGNRPS